MVNKHQSVSFAISIVWRRYKLFVLLTDPCETLWKTVFLLCASVTTVVFSLLWTDFLTLYPTFRTFNIWLISSICFSLVLLILFLLCVEFICPFLLSSLILFVISFVFLSPLGLYLCIFIRSLWFVWLSSSVCVSCIISMLLSFMLK